MSVREFYRKFYRKLKVGGLEGVVNGLPKPIVGLLGTQIVYNSEKG